MYYLSWHWVLPKPTNTHKPQKPVSTNTHKPPKPVSTEALAAYTVWNVFRTPKSGRKRLSYDFETLLCLLHIYSIAYPQERSASLSLKPAAHQLELAMQGMLFNWSNVVFDFVGTQQNMRAMQHWPETSVLCAGKPMTLPQTPQICYINCHCKTPQEYKQSTSIRTQGPSLSCLWLVR